MMIRAAAPGDAAAICAIWNLVIRDSLVTVTIEERTESGAAAEIAARSGVNPGCIAFRAALGIAEVGRLPEVGFKFGRWLNLVLMQKILMAGPEAPDKARVAG